MTYDELKEKVMDYFSDRSRCAAQTKEDLETLAEETKLLADSIDPCDDQDDED